VSPIKTSEFETLKEVSNIPRRHGRKVDWQKVRDFLAANKELAYQVKEIWDWTNANAIVAGTSISRVRVYKELEKYTKKGLVTKKVDESGAGYYNWNHIKKRKKKEEKSS
jgi:Fe2+ or Zn2+ uptake regulation protein